MAEYDLQKDGVEEDDIMLNCLDCEDGILFTMAEQIFYYERGLATPKRCKACRLERKKHMRAAR